jgi:hypothetical protein
LRYGLLYRGLIDVTLSAADAQRVKASNSAIV